MIGVTNHLEAGRANVNKIDPCLAISLIEVK